MANNATFAEVAALAGDPARAGMLQALMDGRALTASELARIAGVTPQTASGHLARLTTAGLIEVQQQGRHRYHRLASPAVAQMMESIMQVAARHAPSQRKLTIGPGEGALRAARTCYDHLAGRLGVALTDALVTGGQLELARDAGLMTQAGVALLHRLGIDVEPMVARRSSGGRVLCRPCLDWSERRPHLAGAVGAALCSLSFANGWIRRIDGTRAVTVTPKGQRSYHELFGMALD